MAFKIGNAITGGLAGAAIGAGVGGPIGAGIGLVAGAAGLGLGGDALFGNEANERAYEIAKAREEAERRAKERFAAQKLVPDALKKEYGENLKRNLQQTTGGYSAALASQRGLNPALAAHEIGRVTAETGANAAGIGTLAQEQIDYQTQLYNNELQNAIFSQEYNAALGAASYTGGGRQEDRMRLDNLISSAATIGLTLYGQQGKTPTTPDVAGTEVAPKNAPNRLNLGVNSSYGQKYGLGVEQNPFAPPGYTFTNSYYNHDFERDNSYHKALTTMATDDHTPLITNMMYEFEGKRRAA